MLGCVVWWEGVKFDVEGGKEREGMGRDEMRREGMGRNQGKTCFIHR